MTFSTWRRPSGYSKAYRSPADDRAHQRPEIVQYKLYNTFTILKLFQHFWLSKWNMKSHMTDSAFIKSLVEVMKITKSSLSNVCFFHSRILKWSLAIANTWWWDRGNECVWSTQKIQTEWCRRPNFSLDENILLFLTASRSSRWLFNESLLRSFSHSPWFFVAI